MLQRLANHEITYATIYSNKSKPHRSNILVDFIFVSVLESF